jgi:hypothetical protein
MDNPLSWSGTASTEYVFFLRVEGETAQGPLLSVL